MTRTTDPKRVPDPLQDRFPQRNAAPLAADPPSAHGSADPVPVQLPEEAVVEARNSLTLRCGKSSITLHANGKIVLRGEYILSDAESINRIAGGQIELN